MTAVSFGYVSGDGTGLNQLEGRIATRYINTTGAIAYIDSLHLINVSTAIASGATIQLALYAGDSLGPRDLLATTPTVSSIVLGTTIFALSNIIAVGPDQGIWVARRDGSIRFDGATAANRSLTFDSVPVFPTLFDQPSADPYSFILPVELHGDTVGPGTVTNLLTPVIFTEPVTEGQADLQTSYILTEPMLEGYPNLQTPYVLSEPLTEGQADLETSYVFAETLHPVPLEAFMSTEPFPGFGNSLADPSIPAGASPINTALPGLKFDVKKVPNFNTAIKQSASGNEVRNALQEYPSWDFEVGYEFLEDRTGAASSLKTIMGFFLSRRGAFDTWLFKDPDDYLVDGGTIATADGATTQFTFARKMGTFLERIGQVDTANTITLFGTIDETQTIPITPGPYTITVVQAATFVEDLGVTVGGIAFTKVTSAPADNQYSVSAGGVYTFSSTDNNLVAVIRYRYTLAAASYTVTMPNLIVFAVAPATGIEITANFQFYFVCRFKEDTLEFSKFSDQLWELQTCEFRSLIQ